MNGTVIIDTEVLPCGCVVERRIENGERVLMYVPCRQNCTNYHNAIDLARTQRLPIAKRHGR